MKGLNTENIDKLTAGKGEGMTVPEGYFEDFAVKMAAKLPYREELDVPVSAQSKPRHSRWMQIRPYVYMAAMFAGAWCLIKMFTLMSPAATEVSISNYPSLSVALENEEFVDDYILDNVSSFEILEDTFMDSMDNGSEETAIAPENDGEASYILPGNGTYLTPPSTDEQL